jgi:glycogen operon protein
MLHAGDEMGRTQRGNNNAYCQDNEISWIDWRLDARQQDLLAFTQHIVGLFRAQPVLKRRRFFQGRSVREESVKDITWYAPGGHEMTGADWSDAGTHSLGVRLDGTQIDETDPNGDPIVGDTLFLMFSAQDIPLTFTLPARATTERWERLLDTADARWGRRVLVEAPSWELPPHAVAVFRLVRLPANGRAT